MIQLSDAEKDGWFISDFYASVIFSRDMEWLTYFDGSKVSIDTK